MNSNFFIHPYDAKALKAMKAIPAFTMVAKKFSDIFMERSFKLTNLSSNLRISEKQLPEIYNLLPPICEKLEIPVPELYLENNPEINAYTSGDKTPFIVLTSGLITHCSPDVIRAVMAHECGHIVCHHVLYKTMVRFMLGAGSSIINLPFLSFALEYAMLDWDRCSEYSADRASAYVCGGPDPVVKTMTELACGSSALVDKIDKEEFLRQAKEFKQYSDESKWNKFLMYYSLVDMDHPFLADRALDIVEWCKSNDFLKIDAPGAAPEAWTLPESTGAVDNGAAASEPAAEQAAWDDVSTDADTSANYDTATDLSADLGDDASVGAAGGVGAGGLFKKAFAGAKSIAGKGVNKISGAADSVKELTAKDEVKEEAEESTGADAACPECGGKIKTTDTVCPSCGVKFIHCPNCDALLTDEDFFCDKCGTKLK